MSRVGKLLIKAVATGGFSGYWPLWPGTAGTIPAWLIAFLLIRGNTAILAAVALATVFISVWVAGRAETMFGHDARKIVIDEWAGMFLALLLVPFSVTNYLIAFFAFRVFDVIKLPPAARAEKLPGGWGVTMDDVAAGIQANLTTQLILLVMARLNVG